jgi:hypothetical protein
VHALSLSLSPEVSHSTIATNYSKDVVISTRGIGGAFDVRPWYERFAVARVELILPRNLKLPSLITPILQALTYG